MMRAGQRAWSWASRGGTSLRFWEGRGFPTFATPVEDSGTCHPAQFISLPSFLMLLVIVAITGGSVRAQEAIVATESITPPSLIDLPTPLESRPYIVRMLVATDSVDSSAISQQLAFALDRSVGGLWRSTIHELTGLSRADSSGLGRWQAEDARQKFADEEVDFWFAVTVHDHGPRREIAVRAWQPKFEWLSPVHSADIFEPRETAGRIVQLCWGLFRPEIRIEEVDQNAVRVRIPAGDLQPADPAYRLFQPGDCLIPWLMYYDRQHVLQRRQELPWSYIRVDEITGPLAKGVVLSGLRTPLAGKTRGRIEKVAVASRAVFPETTIQISVQNQPSRQLAGYRLELRPKLPEPKLADEENKKADPKESETAAEPAEIRTVLTDRLGQTTLLPIAGQPLTWVYVYSGDLLLARVPFVPGSLPFQRLEVPDDSVRLLVEGQLQVLQSELINLVAERNTLIAAARAASKKNDWQRMTALRTQLDSVPTKQVFVERLAGIRVPAVAAAKARRDRNGQVRIERLCQDVNELIDRYLDLDKLQLIKDDLEELQKAAKSDDAM